MKSADERTDNKVGLGGRLPVLLLDVLWFVCHHAKERIELKGARTQIQKVYWISKKILQ